MQKAQLSVKCKCHTLTIIISSWPFSKVTDRRHRSVCTFHQRKAGQTASQSWPTPTRSKVTKQPTHSNATSILNHAAIFWHGKTMQSPYKASFISILSFLTSLAHCASAGISTVCSRSHDVCRLWGRFTPQPQHGGERGKEAGLLCSARFLSYTVRIKSQKLYNWMSHAYF